MPQKCFVMYMRLLHCLMFGICLKWSASSGMPQTKHWLSKFDTFFQSSTIGDLIFLEEKDDFIFQKAGIDFRISKPHLCKQPLFFYDWDVVNDHVRLYADVYMLKGYPDYPLLASINILSTNNTQQHKRKNFPGKGAVTSSLTVFPAFFGIFNFGVSI